MAKAEFKIENGLVQLDELSAEIANRLKQVLQLSDEFERLAGRLCFNAAQIAEAELVHGCGDAVRMFWKEYSMKLFDARLNPRLNDLDELIEDRKDLAAYVKKMSSSFGPGLAKAKLGRQRAWHRGHSSNVSP
jgi:hypothetical protein